LVEFLEVDPDMLAAAVSGSVRASGADSVQADRADERVTAWLNEWSRDEMAAVLKLIAQGQEHAAERRVRARHAAWLKAQPASSTPVATRRSSGQLRVLAQSASGVRREREATERAEQEAGRRRQREATLRLLMADVDKRWTAVDALAQRGSASGYEQAVRALAELAEGYALTSSRREFDRALRRLLVRHATRGAFMRRLTEAELLPG
jgi:hypothetical protein